MNKKVAIALYCEIMSCRYIAVGASTNTTSANEPEVDLTEVRNELPIIDEFDAYSEEEIEGYIPGLSVLIFVEVVLCALVVCLCPLNVPNDENQKCMEYLCCTGVPACVIGICLIVTCIALDSFVKLRDEDPDQRFYLADRYNPRERENENASRVTRDRTGTLRYVYATVVVRNEDGSLEPHSANQLHLRLRGTVMTVDRQKAFILGENGEQKTMVLSSATEDGAFTVVDDQGTIYPLVLGDNTILTYNPRTGGLSTDRVDADHPEVTDVFAQVIAQVDGTEVSAKIPVGKIPLEAEGVEALYGFRCD